MDNARAGRLGLIALWNSTKQKVIRQLKAEELAELEAQNKIGWFMQNGNKRAYLIAEPSFDPYKSRRFKY